MEEDKYFVPDIEDFHVGYECEVNWNRAYVDEFIPIKLKICDELDNGVRDCYNSNVEDVLIAYDDGYAEFRTPYLTKEQIEAEGWEVIDDKNPAKFKHPVEVDVQVIYDFENHYLWITIPAEIVKEKIKYRANKYAGYCKSINEFRYISKLLQLNV